MRGFRLNRRQRNFVGRLAGYATNPIKVQARSRLGREQQWEIAGHTVTLPPDHNLPFYQRRDPTYDRYAEGLVAQIAQTAERVVVIDLGANVGDTAVAMLGTADNTRVISVEGHAPFVEYLRRNTAPFGDRVEVVEKFVGPIAGARLSYAVDGSTGGFGVGGDGTATVHWVTPKELLERTAPDDLVVWKSDVDGFDIHILADHWQVLQDRCAALWFEFDPSGTLGDPADVARLIELVADSGRNVLIYDNLGRRMLTATSGQSARDALVGLTAWLSHQRTGFLTVPYLDVWAVRPELGDLL